LETRPGIKAPLEEIALELCAKTLRSEARVSPEVPTTATSDRGRIVRVLRQLESQSFEPLTLPDLARTAGLSRFHFLRTFKRVTGVTPHQWILRARLREAAQRLAVSKEPVTEIAFEVGFEDLSDIAQYVDLSPSRPNFDLN
jgi:transcriptional regulator GlxA family with amidase domain